MTPPKLSVDSSGRVHGSNVSWNSPFPCPNGDSGGMAVPSGIIGVVQHTQVGHQSATVAYDPTEPGAYHRVRIAEFNNPGAQASAHFAVAFDGSVHQFGSVLGWKAWAEEAGNSSHFSIEFEDGGDPNTPMTQAQINSGAQLVELLSRSNVGRFALQISGSTTQEGLCCHFMGGASWGGHTCPDLPPKHVRSEQRPSIISIAKAIRGGAPAVPVKVWTCAGQDSLANLCSGTLHNGVSTVLRLTCERSPGSVFTSQFASYINQVFAADTVKVPAGISLRLGGEWFTTTGHQTLLGIADGRGLHPAGVLQATAESSDGELFAGNLAGYIDSVFSRSALHVPSGVHLYYEA